MHHDNDGDLHPRTFPHFNSSFKKVTLGLISFVFRQQCNCHSVICKMAREEQPGSHCLGTSVTLSLGVDME